MKIYINDILRTGLFFVNNKKVDSFINYKLQYNEIKFRTSDILEYKIIIAGDDNYEILLNNNILSIHIIFENENKELYARGYFKNNQEINISGDIVEK